MRQIFLESSQRALSFYTKTNAISTIVMKRTYKHFVFWVNVMIFEYLIIWHKTSLLGREWLHIGDQGTLFCNTCIQHGKSGEKNPFVQGCTSHKKDSIISHEKSRYHLNAVKAKQMKELPLGKSPAEKVITTLHAKDERG